MKRLSKLTRGGVLAFLIGLLLGSSALPARADCRAPGPSNPILAASKGVTRYVSPDGTGSGGTQTDPMSLQAALTTAKPGDVMILADGIYHQTAPVHFIPAGTSSTNMTVYKAADCARPIITNVDGSPPTIYISDYMRLDGLWIGGSPKPLSPVGGIFPGNNPTGVYRQFTNCTIFGYYGGVDQASTEQTLYQGNRFVNDGGGSFGHPIYVAGGYPTTPNVDGGWTTQHTIIDGNIFVGNQGYSMHFWHHNHSDITTRNFVGLSQWAEVMDGSDGLIANNFFYNNQAPGLSPANHHFIINNLFGDATNGTGFYEDYSNSIFPNTNIVNTNAFLVTPLHTTLPDPGYPPYGNNPILLDTDLSENQAGIPTASINSAMNQLVASFQQPITNILTDSTIEPAFAQLRFSIPSGSVLYQSGQSWTGGSAPNLGPDTPAPNTVDGFWSTFYALGLYNFNRWGDIVTTPPVSTVRGNWEGNFGADGYMIANDGTQLPAYAVVSLASMITGASSDLCSTSYTADARGLQSILQPSSRVVSCWETAPAPWPTLRSLTLDINLTDGQQHKISLYLLDFWASQLSSAIQVFDAITGALLQSKFMPEDSFMGGQYVSFNLSGHVLVRFTDPGYFQSGTVLSAVFFDPVSNPGRRRKK